MQVWVILEFLSMVLLVLSIRRFSLTRRLSTCPALSHFPKRRRPHEQHKRRTCAARRIRLCRMRLAAASPPPLCLTARRAVRRAARSRRLLQVRYAAFHRTRKLSDIAKAAALGVFRQHGGFQLALLFRTFRNAAVCTGGTDGALARRASFGFAE